MREIIIKAKSCCDCPLQESDYDADITDTYCKIDEMVDRYNCEYCNFIGENDMCEAKEGEWIRYDDIKHILQNTSSNSDYAKCKIEAEIKRLEDNPEGDYVTRISALEWALRIVQNGEE